MKVAYYTSVNFLDSFIETIQSIKDKVELHIFIEITNQSKKATFINVDTLENLNFIETPERVLGKEQWNSFKDYFDGVASVQFIVHTQKKSLTFNTFKLGLGLGRTFKKLKIELIHFDSFSIKAIGLFPFLFFKKVVVTVHDPIAHSGEFDWKTNCINYFFMKHARGVIFYSKYAESQFLSLKKNRKHLTYPIKLQPYSYIRKYLSNNNNEENYILFFGRLSYYKGIDILLKAIPIVLEKYPDEIFLIAGLPYYGFKIDQDLVETHKKNIKIISEFIETDKLVALIQNSKFVVCPYRDATQSGVLMTSFAAEKTVIATNVGSFNEYIQNDYNGLLSETDPISLASKIVEALNENKYKKLELNINPCSTKIIREEIGNKIIDAYKH